MTMLFSIIRSFFLAILVFATLEGGVILQPMHVSLKANDDVGSLRLLGPVLPLYGTRSQTGDEEYDGTSRGCYTRRLRGQL